MVSGQWGRGACAADIEWIEVSDADGQSTTRRTVFVAKNYPGGNANGAKLGKP